MLEISPDQKYRGASFQQVQRTGPSTLRVNNKPPIQMVGSEHAHTVKSQCPSRSYRGSVQQLQQNTSPVLHTTTDKTVTTMSGSQHPHAANSQRPSNPHWGQSSKKVQTVSVATQTCHQHQTDYGIGQLPSNLMQISAESGHKSNMELLVSKMKSANFQDQVHYLYWINLCQCTSL